MLNYAAYCDKNNFIRKIKIENRLNNGGFYEKLLNASKSLQILLLVHQLICCNKFLETVNKLNSL